MIASGWLNKPSSIPRGAAALEFGDSCYYKGKLTEVAFDPLLVPDTVVTPENVALYVLRSAEF